MGEIKSKLNVLRLFHRQSYEMWGQRNKTLGMDCRYHVTTRIVDQKPPLY